MKRDHHDLISPDIFGRKPERKPDYDQLEATELYCSECCQAVPVRKSLLLILPEGDKYEYCCQYCGATVGDKLDHSGHFHGSL
jgi:hypothetical protein